MEAQTVTQLDSFVTATDTSSVTFNLENRTSIGVPGTVLTNADRTTTNTGDSVNSFAATALPSGSWIWINITGVTGNPGVLVISLACTVP
jgi:hypothetical protein